VKSPAQKVFNRLYRKNLSILASIRHGEELLPRLYPGFHEKEIARLLEETWSRPYVFENFTHFKEAPFQGSYVNVDPMGFRVSANQAPWPPDKKKYFNIFLYGGSTAFGYGVPDGETVASHLQDTLFDLGRKEGIRVYNFGRGHYYSTQERILFEQTLLSGALPDMALFMDGLNEFFYYGDNGTAVSSDFEKLLAGDLQRLWLKDLRKKSPLWRMLRNTRKEIKRAVTGKGASRKSEKYSGYDASVLEEAIHRYGMNKSLIEAVAAFFGISTVFVWEPVSSYRYDPAHHPFAKEGFRRHSYTRFGYPLMEGFLASHHLGNNFIDSACILEGADEPLFVDLVHFSPRLSKLLAHYIAGQMREKSLL
jgi:hypothetical protein